MRKALCILMLILLSSCSLVGTVNIASSDLFIVDGQMHNEVLVLLPVYVFNPNGYSIIVYCDNRPILISAYNHVFLRRN